jgi:hypothetical protein
MLTRRSLLRLAALAPLAATRAASAQAPDAEWKKVIEAARTEGQLQDEMLKLARAIYK